MSAQQEKRCRSQYITTQETKQQQKQKLLSYAQYVKDVHMPPVSHKKQNEIKQLKLRLKHPIRKSQRVTAGTAMPMSVSPDFKSHFGLPKRPAVLQPTTVSETPKTKHEFLKRNPKNISSIGNPCDTPGKLFAFLKNDEKYVNWNYLGKWFPGQKFSDPIKLGQWQNYLYDNKMDPKEQFLKVKSTAQMIENKALAKIQHLSGTKSAKKINDVGKSPDYCTFGKTTRFT